MLSPTGTVAEQGTFAALTADPESQFMKLMEWQMSGGEPGTPGGGSGGGIVASPGQSKGPPTEKEREELMRAEEGEVGVEAEAGELAQVRTASADSDRR